MEPEKVKITVFTPTYNRAPLLGRLYESLCRQSYGEFEWLVVDDGSTDGTEGEMQRFMAENHLDIRYLRQANGGKHRAINRGVAEAGGELFFIVDSDDYLTPDALEAIVETYMPLRGNSNYAGVSGLRRFSDGTKVGGEEAWRQIDSNALDIRFGHGVRGDLSEVFRTAVLKEFPFPEFEGEKFCPEALVWNRIAQKYLMRYVYRKIYCCEYLPGGLTANIVKLRRNSPKASALYYSELSGMDIPFAQKLKAAINFRRFYTPEASVFRRNINPILSLLSLIPGKLMRARDSRRL